MGFFFSFSCRGRGASVEHLELKETEYVSVLFFLSFFFHFDELLACLVLASE